MSESVAVIDEALLKSMTEDIVDEVHPEEVILFGSRARGTENNRSDVDLLVVLADDETTRHSRRRITGRLYRRLASFPIPKDILVFTRGEVERWRHVPGHVISTGLNEGKRLYARP